MVDIKNGNTCINEQEKILMWESQYTHPPPALCVEKLLHKDGAHCVLHKLGNAFQTVFLSGSVLSQSWSE